MRSSVVKPIIALVVVIVVIGVGSFVFFGLQKKKEVPPPAAPVVEVRGPQREIIGRSVENRAIESYTYGTGGKHLVFVGGVHGGYEWNSVLLAYRFLDYLDEQIAAASTGASAFPAGLTITVIPSLNPDGVYAATGKEGRFAKADVSGDATLLASARFNAHKVDLNRNFDCKWSPSGMWQNKKVSTGNAAFSEPESVALRDFVGATKPDAVVFWHSKANAVYASECHDGILPGTLDIMNAYSRASGYAAIDSFDAYPVTGDAEGWLASIGIPAITVELKTRDDIEWDQNLAGIKALFRYFDTIKI